MSAYYIALVIGFLSLDTTVAFQVLISQPLFSCPILGLLLGDVQAGFEIGLLMQLLWLSNIPAGASRFPEGNLASMVISAIYILNYAPGVANSLLAFAFVVGLLVSYMGSYITVLDRKINGIFFDQILSAAREARLSKITLIEGISVLVYFLLMSALSFVSIVAANAVFQNLQPFLGPFIDNKFIFIKPLIFGMGIAFTIPMIYKTIKHQKGVLWDGK